MKTCVDSGGAMAYLRYRPILSALWFDRSVRLADFADWTTFRAYFSSAEVILRSDTICERLALRRCTFRSAFRETFRGLIGMVLMVTLRPPSPVPLSNALVLFQALIQRAAGDAEARGGALDVAVLLPHHAQDVKALDLGEPVGGDGDGAGVAAF